MKHQKINQDYMEGMFDILNGRHFKGKLPSISMEFFSIRDTKKKFGKRFKVTTSLRGYFQHDTISKEPIKIGINKDYRNSFEYTLFIKTLLHEMIHYYFFLKKGKTYKQMANKGDGHTDQFKKKMKRLGKKEARHLIKKFKTSVTHSFIDKE